MNNQGCWFFVLLLVALIAGAFSGGEK